MVLDRDHIWLSLTSVYFLGSCKTFMTSNKLVHPTHIRKAALISSEYWNIIFQCHVSQETEHARHSYIKYFYVTY
jgi:hypothetical protein